MKKNIKTCSHWECLMDKRTIVDQKFKITILEITDHNKVKFCILSYIHARKKLP